MSVSATQRIVSAISEAIVEHRLPAGAKLGEQKIADMFGVSRTIVRQALFQLARDKLVQLEKAKGATVATPSREEARQVFATRRLIEQEMAKQLAAVITPAHIKILRQHLAEEKAALQHSDARGRTRLLADFHVKLAELLGNQVLADIMAELSSRTALVSLLYQSDRSAGHSSEEHEGIVDALEQKDAKKVVRLMREHLEHVENHLGLASDKPDLKAALLPHKTQNLIH